MLNQSSQERLLEFYNECEDERFREISNALAGLMTVNEVDDESAELSIDLLQCAYMSQDFNDQASDLLALISAYIVTAPARVTLLNMLASHINVACNESIQAVLSGKMKISMDVSKGGKDGEQV